MIFNNVDLPEPFRPTIPKKSPLCTSKLISFKTRCSVKPFIPLNLLTKVVLKLFVASVGNLKDLLTCSTFTAISF